MNRADIDNQQWLFNQLADAMTGRTEGEMSAMTNIAKAREKYEHTVAAEIEAFLRTLGYYPLTDRQLDAVARLVEELT